MTGRTNNGFTTTFGVDARNQLTTQPHGTATYDASGNLTADGVRSFTYDAEQQLVSVSAGTSFRNDFVYDGLGRLRRKLEYLWSGGAWTLYVETRYVYDGRRVIQERNGSDGPQVGYTWGPDVSGSLAGAGGIGGLLGRSHGYSAGSWSAHHHYHADGGGNVTALMDGAQALSANYRYDSYGNLLTSSGSMAGANLMRFSSKLWMASPGLYYYGFRFYEPNFQRWPNRDPIGERYDANLYRFVYNSPLNWIDPDGLWGIQFGENGRNWGWGDPTFVFDNDSWDDIGQGAQATLDGIIPFGDPFMNNGGYDPCDPVLGWSRALGEAARDIYLGKAALKGQELAFGKNFRIAPFGNRTKPGQPLDWRRELPHYHRRGAPGRGGQTPPGQGIGRHRPWEGSKHDGTWGDRF